MFSTRVRYRVVAFTMTLAAITYLDRVCISIMAPRIMGDLRLSTMGMSYVFSAFTLAYALFEIPTAWWADRAGSRTVLTRIVLWWSAFTMATSLAFSYSSLLVIRFLFGAGEAGAWPNAARVFTRWIPADERGRVQGAFFAGAHLSGGLTPLLVVYLARFLPWRAEFLLFGCAGLLWAGAWFWWFRDEPSEHKQVSAAECEWIETTRGLPAAHSGAWQKVFATRSLWPLCLQYFANTYGFYFFITWLPAYLAKARGLEHSELALFSGLPLMLSAFASLIGGSASDALSRRYGFRVGRCGVGAIAYLMAAGVMFCGSIATSGRMAGLLIALGGAASMLSLGSAWATAIELGGRNSALLSAVMNTSGQIGGMLSPVILSYLVEQTRNWSSPLWVLCGLYLMAAVSWCFIHPYREHPDSEHPDWEAR